MKDIIIKEDNLLKLLQDMIKIESVNPTLVKEGSGESEIAYFLGDYIKDLGIDVKYQKVIDDRINTIGILKGKGKGKNLMLNGHTDTVSIEDMQIEPLNPIYKKGKVFGRGAYDMKGGIASQIMAIQSIVESNLELEGDVILTFVADEEYASLGTEKVVEEYDSDAAIICEPSNLQIALAHKGFAWVKVDVHGKKAHGSLAQFGIDAIVKAGKFLVKLEELEKDSLSQKKHPLLGSPSIHASLINGGIELSTYPDYCKIELERRTLPAENQNTVSKEINELIKELRKSDKNFKADYDVFFYRPGIEISKDEPIVQSLSNAYRTAINKEPKFMGFSGWMDSAILKEAGIPTTIFGPKGAGAHLQQR